jgi:hypothetical protein
MKTLTELWMCTSYLGVWKVLAHAVLVPERVWRAWCGVCSSSL